ncbi:hypothetical protein J437_LFUL006479 [Ladona fulva]|uniref:TGF-beta family profile domain-containing protein n=1 Tax=Ladona fulva TaxID=123851 RepID=A0A8K0NZJ4_LADFU|nr:hypothetical protein J437_LFUL006479 [Ladona fulva]
MITRYPFYYGKTEEAEEDVQQQSSSNDSAAVPSEGCERKSLYVDFRLIGWSSWIIAPKVFDLGVCHGQCDFPLDRRQNPTNHAAIQSIVHELGLVHGVRKPCCVPSSLLPLHILFFDPSGNVVLKMTKGVVAEKCSCR